MSDDDPSNRQLRKQSRAKAHQLRNDAVWGAPVKSDPMQKLRELDQQMRGARVYGESDECQACVEVRAKRADETALCETHLADAMGF